MKSTFDTSSQLLKEISRNELVCLKDPETSIAALNILAVILETQFKGKKENLKSNKFYNMLYKFY